MADEKATLGTIPQELAEQLYKHADAHMEKLIEAGMLTNRFTIRAYGCEMMMHGFNVGQSCPSEETARKIWDAAYNLGRMDYDEKDFKNFYKALIEGK